MNNKKLGEMELTETSPPKEMRQARPASPTRMAHQKDCWDAPPDGVIDVERCLKNHQRADLKVNRLMWVA